MADDAITAVVVGGRQPRPEVLLLRRAASRPAEDRGDRRPVGLSPAGSRQEIRGPAVPSVLLGGRTGRPAENGRCRNQRNHGPVPRTDLASPARSRLRHPAGKAVRHRRERDVAASRSPPAEREASHGLPRPSLRSPSTVRSRRGLPKASSETSSTFRRLSTSATTTWR